MSSKQESIKRAQAAFNDFITSEVFNGIVTSHDYYEFCVNHGIPMMSNSHMNWLGIGGVKALAEEAQLYFSSSKPQRNIRENRIRILKECFKILDSGTLKVNESVKTATEDEFVKGNLQKYIGINNVHTLHKKKLIPESIPNWNVPGGKYMLELFANSTIQSFDEFLITVKSSNGIAEIETETKPKQGIIYFKETEFEAKHPGYIVAKVGRSENRDLSRAMSANDIQLSFESRVYGTDDIKQAENDAIRCLCEDILCINFDKPNNSPLGRNREYFEMPPTHFNTAAQYVKEAAKKFSNSTKQPSELAVVS
ncbi:hypothetical protein [Vibrio brasiliensis]|uniref:hypothetical protein n=1 Tax=Vibrio brasiliensis TaxID=170652 RepID=UPI001EFDDC98|nr:hypothetical protein [Vibrio brasiliensis]MCG9727498.1 hypothetical protein [Vibrio brasiliensis]